MLKYSNGRWWWSFVSIRALPSMRIQWTAWLLCKKASQIKISIINLSINSNGDGAQKLSSLLFTGMYMYICLYNLQIMFFHSLNLNTIGRMILVGASLIWVITCFFMYTRKRGLYKFYCWCHVLIIRVRYIRVILRSYFLRVTHNYRPINLKK